MSRAFYAHSFSGLPDSWPTLDSCAGRCWKIWRRCRSLGFASTTCCRANAARVCRCSAERVGTPLIVEAAPCIDCSERRWSALVEAFLSETPVEAFDRSVIRRWAASREAQRQAVFVGPALHHLAGKLDAVADFDVHRSATHRGEPSHRPDELLAAQRLGTHPTPGDLPDPRRKALQPRALRRYVNDVPDFAMTLPARRSLTRSDLAADSP